MTTKRTTAKDLLTPMEVKHAPDGWLNDGAGLHLRTKGKSKKWVFRYVRDGRAVEIGCGGADRVTLKMARQLREKYLAALAEGLDPRAEKAKLAAGRKTFAEAASELIEARRKKWRTAVNDGRTSSLDEWTKSLTVDCKKIASRLVGDITVDDIKPIVKPLWDRGHEASARRLLNRIELTFDYAMAHNWRTADNPATWKKFQHILQAQGEDGPKPMHAALDWRAAPAFMARLRADTQSPMAALALEMMILTACRSGEVRGMLWSEIGDDGVWRVPGERMKGKRPHEVPLSSAALAILKRLGPAQIGKFVFPGRSNAKPIDNATVWLLVQRLTGREKGRSIVSSVHGMRSSFRSWAAFHRVDHDLAEVCLAHKVGSAVSQRYNRESLLDLRRPIMENWASFLRGADVDNVIELRRAGA